MPDLDQLLHDTAPTPAGPVDVAAIRSLVRTRRRRRHVATGIASVAVVTAVGIGLQQLTPRPAELPIIDQAPTPDTAPTDAAIVDEVVTESLPSSQSPADARRDGIVPEIAALPLETRLDPAAAVVTPEGIWMSSQTGSLEGSDGCAVGDTSGEYGRDFVCDVEYAEIVLLSPDGDRIVRAWPLPGLRNLDLVVQHDAVWGYRQGDGGLPDAAVVRIDRFERPTRELRGRLFVAPAVDGEARSAPDGINDAIVDDDGPALSPDDLEPGTDVVWFDVLGSGPAESAVGFTAAFDLVRFEDPQRRIASTQHGTFAVEANGSVSEVDPANLTSLREVAPASTRADRVVAAQPLLVLTDDGGLTTVVGGTPAVLATEVQAVAPGLDGRVAVLDGAGDLAWHDRYDPAATPALVAQVGDTSGAAQPGPPTPVLYPTTERLDLWGAVGSRTTIPDESPSTWLRTPGLDTVELWFADPTSFEMSAWYRLVASADGLSPSARLEIAVELLALDPPVDRLSAFSGGLTVGAATATGDLVQVDLDGGSAGLQGQGSAGLVVGTSQLALVTRAALPDARTLCVTYDGVPTTVSDGGPSFLHDADGCPIDLAAAVATALGARPASDEN